MGSQQIELTQDLLDYLLAHGEPPPDLLASAEKAAADAGWPSMQVSSDQAVLLRFLIRLVGARRVLEIGTFTGLSALMLALGVGPGGKVVCLDKNAEWTAKARRLWAEAGVADRIELRLGIASDTLREMAPDEKFDAVFIDADKGSYQAYLEAVVPLLAPGGLVMVDNTLWYGKVVDESATDADTEAIRAFNRALAGDPRFEVVIVPIGDGLTLARLTAP